MTYKDIFRIAESIERTIPEIASDNGGVDERDKISVTLTVSRDEIDDINENLYLLNHRDKRGLDYVDELVINVYNIRFKVVCADNSN